MKRRHSITLPKWGLSVIASLVLTLCLPLAATAQTSLAGRVYHHPNIMKGMTMGETADVDKAMADAKAKAIAEEEKKKGRKLTESELSEVNQKVKEARKVFDAVVNSSKAAVTVTFKSDTELLMKMNMTTDEDALKAAGVGWMKRKALKAATSMGSTSQKMKYRLQGNLVICSDGSEKDTLQLSPDGKFLSGKTDEKEAFRLTRTK